MRREWLWPGERIASPELGSGSGKPGTAHPGDLATAPHMASANFSAALSVGSGAVVVVERGAPAAAAAPLASPAAHLASRAASPDPLLASRAASRAALLASRAAAAAAATALACSNSIHSGADAAESIAALPPPPSVPPTTCPLPRLLPLPRAAPRDPSPRVELPLANGSMGNSAEGCVVPLAAGGSMPGGQALARASPGGHAPSHGAGPLCAIGCEGMVAGAVT